MDHDYVTEKRHVRRAFDRAARSYDSSAVLQREVGERMLSRLEYVRIDPEIILDAGSGTGKGRQDLGGIYPHAGIVELDLSLAMLCQARPDIPWWKRPFSNMPQQVCGDIEHLPIKSSSVSMVWSNLALQWCNDLDGALSEIRRILKPQGLFMFSTFGPDTLKEVRQAFSGTDAHAHVNRFIDMHDIGDALIQSGFATPVMDMECITLTYADVRAVMQDLKSIGAHNVMQGRPRGLFGKSAWAKVVENYESMRQGGRLPATFEVVYGHAWKPEPRATADGSQIIRFAQRPL
jgi:malonyl-CoA O-methyltransferase